MTLVFALFVLQTRSAPAFIEECSKAVAAIEEGQYGYKVDRDDYSQKLVIVLKDGQRRFSAVWKGKPYLDVWLTPTSELIVQHEERQYSQTEFPELKKKKKNPLEPLEYGMFDFKMGTEGLIIRANPELVADKVDVTDGVETLYARSVKSDGKTIQLVLSRDEKTKLPTRLKASKEGEKDVFLEFLCNIRPVKDEELTIPASAYAGYKKVDPPKSPSGTL